MAIEIILSLLILGDIFTVILIFAYQLQYKTDKAINLFLLGNLLEAVAWILLVLKQVIPIFLSISFGNSILFFGATLKIIAFLNINGGYNKTIKKAYIRGLIVSIVAFNLIAVFLNYDNIRASASSGILVALWTYPVFKLLTEKKSSILQRVIAILYSIALLIFVLRTYTGLITGSSLSLMSTDLLNELGFISLYLVMIVGNIGFILLSKEKADKKLLNAAMYDELTGIFNRSTFKSQAELTISQYFRKKEYLSLMTMDLDHFKLINDLHGHYSGDLVLKDFSSSIQKQLRPSDLFGRFGGEEFIVLLPGTNKKEAVVIAERLRNTIENSIVIAKSEIKYTVSIGVITIIPDEKTTLEVLYKLSDDLLYKAKNGGRNRVEAASM